MHKKLEQLLNSLIEKGWKPFKLSNVNTVDIYKELVCFEVENPKYGKPYRFFLHELTSMESWLWQFVCELKKEERINWCSYEHNTIICQWERYLHYDPKYWIMLSSIQEDIPKFLLDNIKLNE